MASTTLGLRGARVRFGFGAAFSISPAVATSAIEAPVSTEFFTLSVAIFFCSISTLRGRPRRLAGAFFSDSTAGTSLEPACTTELVSSTTTLRGRPRRFTATAFFTSDFSDT